MDQVPKKPLLTPREALIDKVQRRAVEQRPPKPLAGESIRGEAEWKTPAFRAGARGCFPGSSETLG